MPHPVPLLKATVPMDKCRTGILATQCIPQPQEHIQATCTHLRLSMQRQGASLIPHPPLHRSMQCQGGSLIPHPLLRHSMQHQVASLTPLPVPLLVLHHNSCTLRSRCRHLSMKISQEAHLELANRCHHHHTTVKLNLLLLLYLTWFFFHCYLYHVILQYRRP